MIDSFFEKYKNMVRLTDIKNKIRVKYIGSGNPDTIDLSNIAPKEYIKEAASANLAPIYSFRNENMFLISAKEKALMFIKIALNTVMNIPAKVITDIFSDNKKNAQMGTKIGLNTVRG
jgi:hypothetical protein